MATVKQILDSYFFSFIDNNGLESLKEKMCETITKCEYELHDVIEKMVDNEVSNSCIDLEMELKDSEEQVYELEHELREERKKDAFFTPKTLQDEFKIQWIKDNWDKIPSI